MKNLPDKIYLNLGELSEEEFNETDFQNLSEVTWSEDDVQGRNVEYTRTDAFIEKAINFLNYKLGNVVATRVAGTTRPHRVAKQELIEDLKKYLED